MSLSERAAPPLERTFPLIYHAVHDNDEEREREREVSIGRARLAHYARELLNIRFRYRQLSREYLNDDLDTLARGAGVTTPRASFR